MAEHDPTLLALCARYQARLLQHDDTRLRVAVTDSPHPQLLEALQFACQRQVEIECWPAARMEQALHPSLSDERLPEQRSAASATEAVNQILHQAVQRRASDVSLSRRDCASGCASTACYIICRACRRCSRQPCWRG